MYFFPVILLAIIQGITEFLPVSSSAHLIIASDFIEFTYENIALDVSLHLGTLLAVIVYFRSDILLIMNGIIDSQSKGRNAAIQIFIATVPIVVFGGLAFMMGIVDYFRNIQVIALSTIIFGIVLYYADIQNDKKTKTINELKIEESFIIGLFQVLAIIPGTSRSGIVYSGGRFLNISRIEALRFAMLLSIPTILLSAFIPAYKFIESPSSEFLLMGIVGLIVSFGTAYLSISLLMSWVRKFSMLPFVIYRIILGSILLIYSIV
jgi:undecaprenyl-diphosphatase